MDGLSTLHLWLDFMEILDRLITGLFKKKFDDKCNRLDVELNRTSSMPKSVLHFELDNCGGDPNNGHSENKNYNNSLLLVHDLL